MGQTASGTSFGCWDCVKRRFAMCTAQHNLFGRRGGVILGNLKERVHLEDLVVDGRAMFKVDLKESVGRVIYSR